MTDRDRVPGTWLQRFAERAFDRETLDRVILPALADLQHECATATGPTLVQRFVRVRAYWALWKAMGLCLLTDAGRQARPTVEGVLGRMAIMLPLVMCAIMAPTLNSALGGSRAGLGLQIELLGLVPQALALGLPIAYFFAVAMDREPASPLRLVPGILGLSFLCSVAMLIVAFAIVPRANQAYRTAVYDHLKATRGADAEPPSLGPDGPTFTDLVSTVGGRSDSLSAAARARLEMRLGLCTLPLAFGPLALGIANRRSRMATFGLGFWALALYVVVLRAASPTRGPSVEALYVVNAAFAMAGLVMTWSRSKFGDYELRSRG